MAEFKIIDVSVHQGKIDWATVKKHVDGVIIRCGYGSDYIAQDDKRFRENVDGCIKHNIQFGVYLYSYAKNENMARSEAKHVLRLLEPYKGKLSYPVYLDLEEKGTESGAAERAIIFGEIIEKAGYWCGIYANDYWWRTLLKGKLDRFTKWVAHYSRKPSKSIGKYDIWQYSSTGVIPGINEEVDMNICYRNFPKEIRGDFSETKPKKSVLEIAKEVIDGLWGNGAERKEKLNAAGYDVKEVQNKVNELLK